MTTPDDPYQTPEPGATPPPPPVPPPPAAPPPQYGAPPPGYAAPPPGYAAPPPGYGAPPAYQGAPGYMPVPQLRNDYAVWGLRVASAFIDYLAIPIVAILFAIAHVWVLAFLLDLVGLAWALYNAYIGGSTGQSVGKRMIGTRLLRESDGQLLGGWMGILRYILHIVDSILCYIGYLWPLWDAKRQTFSDKIVGTIVIKI